MISSYDPIVDIDDISMKKPGCRMTLLGRVHNVNII